MENDVQPPPRLLLGATLLFWGAMANIPLLGLVIAILVESPNWIRFRWDFDKKASSMALRLCLIIIFISGLLIWLDGDRYSTLPRLLTWLPLLLLPLQFVQIFGLSNHMSINDFSFFSKFNRKQNLNLGIESDEIYFNFGNFYFIACITAASLSSLAQQWIFFPCLIILTGWLIFFRVRSRVFAVLVVVSISATIGFVGQIGLAKLHHWVTHLTLQADGLSGSDPTEKKTRIGSLGKLKQSAEILWRITPGDGQAPPRLIRTASYNRYKGINWQSRYPAFITEEIAEDDDTFRELINEDATLENAVYPLHENIQLNELPKGLPFFEIRGTSNSEELLPLPGSSSSLESFKLDSAEINPLGTVRIFPEQPIIQGIIRWKDDSSIEHVPFTEEDLEIDSFEYEGIHAVADALGLKKLPTTQAKIDRLRRFFSSEYTYSRYLSITGPYAIQQRPTAIEAFLTTSKKGHCEYFATASCLLLRAADVPTRYSVGFAMMEKNPRKNEWIVRGTHCHAWTRVWDKESQNWIDFDPTPPGWLGDEIGEPSRLQWLSDLYKCLKEDFFLWRNEPKNRIGTLIVMWVIGLSVLIFMGKRLWSSKLIVSDNKFKIYGAELAPRTPLHQLEKPAAKVLPPRQPGESLVSWLKRLESHNVSSSELEEACSIHQKLRFDPDSQSADEQAKLEAISESLKKQIKKGY